jgi:hypothetical protein
VTAGDTDHLITVAGLPYGRSGFRPQHLEHLEDIATVHLYPLPGASEHDRAVADAAAAKPDGQPLILDETGPIGGGDVAAFILGTAESASGWVGHYFEETPAEIVGAPEPVLADRWHLGFYRTFMRLAPQVNHGDGGIMQP